MSDSTSRTRPELIAAIVNASLVLAFPLLALAASLLVSVPGNTAVAVVSTPSERAFRVLIPLVTRFLPIALFVAWRTWVHAQRVLRHQSAGWQGVFEGGALGFVLALLVLGRGIVTRPLEAPPYVLVYGGGAAVFGMLIAFVLFLAARLTLRLVARPQEA
jgi:hypothetical protein